MRARRADLLRAFAQHEFAVRRALETIRAGGVGTDQHQRFAALSVGHEKKIRNGMACALKLHAPEMRRRRLAGLDQILGDRDAGEKQVGLEQDCGRNIREFFFKIAKPCHKNRLHRMMGSCPIVAGNARMKARRLHDTGCVADRD